MPFFLLKALSFLPFGSFLKGGGLKLIIILVALGALVFGIWKWKDNIKTAVYNQIYVQQAQDHLDTQERLLELSARLMTQREQAVQQALDAHHELEAAIEAARRQVQHSAAQPAEVPPAILEALDSIRRLESGLRAQPEQAGGEENRAIQEWLHRKSPETGS